MMLPEVLTITYRHVLGHGRHAPRPVYRPPVASQPLTAMPISGMVVPYWASLSVRVGPVEQDLADALFTKTQQRVLGVLFGHPERSFYPSELVGEAGTGSGAAQRELARLEESRLIVARHIGNQRHYQANAVSPLFSELRQTSC